MENKRSYYRHDFETLGKYYLKKGVDLALQYEFKASSEFILEGLDFVTCDCTKGEWKKSYDDLDEDLFCDLDITVKNKSSYYFVKAFILSYERSADDLYQALDAIKRYLKVEEGCPYGEYVKGKIYLSLSSAFLLKDKGYDFACDARDCFEKCYDSTQNKRVSYRLGKTINKFWKGEYCRNYIYDAFMANPYSACCADVLHKIVVHPKYNIVESLNIENSETEVMDYFLNYKSQWAFYRRYSDLLGKVKELHLHKGKLIPISVIPLVLELENNFSEFHLDRHVDNFDPYIEYPEQNHAPSKYNGSYAHDVEKLSDDFIDNVLDGRSDAYWNID
jgi:hypothetical protein